MLAIVLGIIIPSRFDKVKNLQELLLDGGLLKE